MVPNLTHGEKSWIIYGKTTDKATESYNFDTVSLASRHGHKIVTYSRHIEAVRLDYQARRRWNWCKTQVEATRPGIKSLDREILLRVTRESTGNNKRG